MAIFKRLSAEKIRKIAIILMVILTAAFAYSSFKIATEMHGTLGYVSDETWYVPSSRNILREVFKIQTSYISPDGGYHYTIFFYSFTYVNETEKGLGDLLKSQYNGYISMKYNKTPALAVVTFKQMDVDAMKQAFTGIELIQGGYPYPDNQGIQNYLNTEHPPLVKYIIGFFMLVFGDQPISWRIPSIIMGTLTLILLCSIVIKLINNEVVVFLLFLFAFVDSIFMAMSSIGMLDIYTAFFLTLSAWLAIRNNYFLSAISIGLSTAAKLTGVFPVVALLIYMVILGLGIIRSVVYSIIVSFITWLTVNVPYILKWGVQTWWSQVEGGLRWHVSSRPEGPPVSTPWGWLYNENAFALNFKPDVIAKVDPVIYFMALIMLIFIPYLYRKGFTKYLVPTFWFASSFLGYVVVYALGNRTLYSFYVITLSPTVYVLAVLLVFYFGEPRMFKDAFKSYYSFLKSHLRPTRVKVQDQQQVILGQE